MLPECLVIRTFLEEETGRARNISDPYVLIKRHTGIGYGCTQWYDPPDKPKDFMNKIFVYENAAYIIKKHEREEESKLCTSSCYYHYFEVELYTNRMLDNLMARHKDIREHLLVCADSLEDLGVLAVATELRDRAENILLENLIPGAKKEFVKMIFGV